jgi:7-cyano-7-deazaguanine synthase in queuosine biosynthesis
MTKRLKITELKLTDTPKSTDFNSLVGYQPYSEKHVAMVDKIPLILFSGGLDSTYLLSETLRTSHADVLYISASQHPDKVTAEQNAIFNILKYLRPKRPYRVRKVYSLDISNLPVFTDYSFGQVPGWLFGSLATVDGAIHSRVSISYVMGDQVSLYLDSIEKAWNALSTCSKIVLTPIEFPLKLTSKKKIMAELHPDLYKLTWVCETPIKIVKTGKIKPCGKCDACITRKLEEYRKTL